MRHRAVAAPAVAVTLALLLTGCSSGPKVRGYDVTAAGKSRCAALIAALPAQVSGKNRVELTDEPYAAAWGDPAIVLRCGVDPKPEGFDKFSTCQLTEGIDWFVPDDVIADQRADVLMTTIGRSPAIDVLVPARYRPTAGPMVDLAAAIKAHTEGDGGCN